MIASDPSRAWLLLIHQLPAKPAYVRVRIWRRLQAIGAVAVKGSVYALPATEQARDDFRRLLGDVVAGGGEAMLCEAGLLDGLSDAQAEALFKAPRGEEYRALAAELRAMKDALPDGPLSRWRGARELRANLIRARRRFNQIAGVDFFGAPGRLEVESLLAAVEHRLTAAGSGDEPPGLDLRRLSGRTWITRQGVYVDRIACAWLIRRFIDPAAKFKFVPTRTYRPAEGELRFDMTDAEFGHEGDRCSFEVLLDRMGSDDPALRALGEIIHDIDLKDGRFQREETAGLAHLIDGVTLAHASDEDRIARGSALLDDMLVFFSRSGTKARAR